MVTKPLRDWTPKSLKLWGWNLEDRLEAKEANDLQRKG
jgi:hypothetical protein